MLKKKKSKPVQAPGSDEVGVLGLHSRFKGNIRFRGMLRLDGEVEGDISSEKDTGTTLVVNANAQITGNIVADSVLISGKVTGNIRATERVEIYRTGVLLGDVTTGDLMVEGGAEFHGQCKMLRPAPEPAKEREKEASGTQGGEKAAEASPA